MNIRTFIYLFFSRCSGSYKVRRGLYGRLQVPLTVEMAQFVPSEPAVWVWVDTETPVCITPRLRAKYLYSSSHSTGSILINFWVFFFQFAQFCLGYKGKHQYPHLSDSEQFPCRGCGKDQPTLICNVRDKCSSLPIFATLSWNHRWLHSPQNEEIKKKIKRRTIFQRNVPLVSHQGTWKMGEKRHRRGEQKKDLHDAFWGECDNLVP